MERKLPKNVRQIGNVSDNPKIYIEDYVDTFFLQLCEQAKEETQGAFLIGDTLSEDGQDYIFVYGAIRMQELKKEGDKIELSDETWKRGYEDCKQYFEDGEMLGWFMTTQGEKLSLTNEIKKIHKKSFSKKNTVFILEDTIEHEDACYANKYNELMHIAGHYVYYEKNPCMQNYMISSRKKNGVSPSETVEDRAAKDFRSLVRTREEAKEQKKITKYLYVASSLLLVIVVAMGITMMNNFNKMKKVETSIASIGTSEEKSDTNTEKKEATTKNVETEERNTTNTDTHTKSVAEASAKVQDAVGATESSMQNEVVTDDTAQGDAAVSSENGSNGIYVVEQGDTLAMISQKCYGDTSHVDAICRMNGLSDGNLIYIGQKLLLP